MTHGHYIDIIFVHSYALTVQLSTFLMPFTHVVAVQMNLAAQIELLDPIATHALLKKSCDHIAHS